MAPVLRSIGGVLGPFALRHLSVKPHRTMAFLLIVALMSSVSVYPVITSGSFEDKAARGARVQIGADWQVLYNAPDLVDASQLDRQRRHAVAGSESGGRSAADIAARRRGSCTRRPTWSRRCCPNFYLPGYGLRGVPLYLLGDGADVSQRTCTPSRALA